MLVRIDGFSFVSAHKKKSYLRFISGFSLTEMLVTTLILTLVATLMATGIPVAIDTYNKLVKTSNAQVALSTTIEALRSQIGLACEVKVAADRIYYRSEIDGGWCSIGNPSDEEDYYGLVKRYYIDDVSAERPAVTDLTSNDIVEPLLTNAAITDSLRVRLAEGGVVSDGDGDVYIKMFVEDVPGGNHLAEVGDDEEYHTANGYRIFTRFAS